MESLVNVTCCGDNDEDQRGGERGNICDPRNECTTKNRRYRCVIPGRQDVSSSKTHIINNERKTMMKSM